MTFETFYLSDEEARPEKTEDKEKGRVKYKLKCEMIVILYSRVHDNRCSLTIKSDTKQHLQFFRCLFVWMPSQKQDS